MSNYTEEDVRQVGLLLDEDVDTLKPNRRPHARARLDVLRAAALEGAKVPGLVAEVAAARAALDEDGVQSQEGTTLAHRIEALSEDRKQEKMRTEDAEAKVSALQARVDELEGDFVRVAEYAKHGGTHEASTDHGSRALQAVEAALSAPPVDVKKP